MKGNTTLTLCDGIRLAPSSGGGGGVWQLIVPAGSPPMDGGSERFPLVDEAAARAIIAAFEAGGNELPIDKHHATQLVMAGKRDEAPRVGWVDALEWRPGGDKPGIYGRCHFIADTATQIRERRWAYFSPVVEHEIAPPHRVTKLTMLTLTNLPRISEAPRVAAAQELLRADARRASLTAAGGSGGLSGGGTKQRHTAAAGVPGGHRGDLARRVAQCVRAGLANRQGR